MYKMIIGFIVGLAVVFVATSAAAQSVCRLRSEVLDQLAKKYGEAPVALGVTNNGDLIEVLTTGDGGTWTIILSNPNGISCFVAAGEGWRTKEYDNSKQEPVI